MEAIRGWGFRLVSGSWAAHADADRGQSGDGVAAIIRWHRRRVQRYSGACAAWRAPRAGLLGRQRGHRETDPVNLGLGPR